MSTKQAQEVILKNMKNWQKIENASVHSTAVVMQETENPIIRLIMEIIQRDSQMHFRIQQLITDSLESKVLTLNPDEIASVWGSIEKHIELEQGTIQLAKESLAVTKDNKGMVLQHYLLEYLLNDEKKHDELLDKLEAVKKGMYPYG